jgi:hypothetical protein
VEQGLEVATDHVLHDEVDAVLGLQRVEELDDKGRLGDGEGVALRDHLLRHVLADHDMLVHDFDGVDLLALLQVLVRLALAQVDLRFEI